MLRIKTPTPWNNIHGPLLSHQFIYSSELPLCSLTQPTLWNYKTVTKIPQSYFVSSVWNAYSSFFLWPSSPVIYLASFQSYFKSHLSCHFLYEDCLTVPGSVRSPFFEERMKLTLNHEHLHRLEQRSPVEFSVMVKMF